MKKKNQASEDETNEKRVNKINGRHSINNKQKMKKNMQRLGGRGLSLEAFANAKTLNQNYNPALIKKQKEFYKNAKYVKKYRRSLKQQEQQNDPSKMLQDQQEQLDNPSLDTRPMEDENETAKADNLNPRRKKNKKDSARSLEELYEKKCEEEEKARMEREAILQAKKEERQKAEARRKALREKMFKKTKSGQPVMKYRIEHLLETIQSSKN